MLEKNWQHDLCCLDGLKFSEANLNAFAVRWATRMSLWSWLPEQVSRKYLWINKQMHDRHASCFLNFPARSILIFIRSVRALPARSENENSEIQSCEIAAAAHAFWRCANSDRECSHVHPNWRYETLWWVTGAAAFCMLPACAREVEINADRWLLYSVSGYCVNLNIIEISLNGRGTKLLKSTYEVWPLSFIKLLIPFSRELQK